MTPATVAPPHSREAEEAVLGAAFLADGVLGRLVDEGLRPAHFWLEHHRLVYRAMLALLDRGEPVDPLTVANASKGVTEAQIVALAGAVPHAGAHVSYARTVMELWDLRRKRHGAMLVLEGVDAQDGDRIAEGEAFLGRTVDQERRTVDPDEMRERLYARLSSREDPETFRWPWTRLDKLCAMRRGQLTLIAGNTRFGKSVVIDQALESASRPGLRSHLYLNEMTVDERADRTISRLGRVAFDRVQRPSILEADEQARLTGALDNVTFGMTDCTGWTAREIARDVLRNRWDVAGVDVFQNIPTGVKTQEKDEAIRVLADVSRLANCQLLLCAHLNRNRAGQSMVMPMPTLADLRDTGMLERLASNVLFVHRTQSEETGDPLPTGVIRFAKARNGRCGGLEVLFDGEHMRFEAKPPRFAEMEREAAA